MCTKYGDHSQLDRLFDELKGHFAELPVSKYGSNVMKGIMKKCSRKQRRAIITELYASCGKLCLHRYAATTIGKKKFDK